MAVGAGAVAGGGCGALAGAGGGLPLRGSGGGGRTRRVFVRRSDAAMARRGRRAQGSAGSEEAQPFLAGAEKSSGEERGTGHALAIGVSAGLSCSTSARFYSKRAAFADGSPKQQDSLAKWGAAPHLARWPLPRIAPSEGIRIRLTAASASRRPCPARSKARKGTPCLIRFVAH